MRILALEPYFGGAHRAFLLGWAQHSEHSFTHLTLPAHHWKWRMRHAAVSFAAEAKQHRGKRFDLIWASSMLNMAEFRGLAGPAFAGTPAVLYFHENQLAYPSRQSEPRDVHFAFEEWVSAHAAEQLWFNSDFNRRTWFSGLDALLNHMPDRPGLPPLTELQARSCIQAPGIDVPSPAVAKVPGPLHIIWAARWEHDKRPEAFFSALVELAAHDVPFQLSVLGEAFQQRPPVFSEAFDSLSKFRHVDIRRFGFAETRAEYDAALDSADVFVSTAGHEFFGLAALEAKARGCHLLLPNRLAYPELHVPRDLYGSDSELLERLISFAADKASLGCLPAATAPAEYYWPVRARALDHAAAAVAARTTLGSSRD